jgi:DNA-binding LytR/AlgR family response regulator
MSAATALLVEDEAPQRADLQRMLAQLWPELQIVAQCEDGLSALEALHSHRPQVLFLDIRIPGLNGLEIARAASGVARVVFTTAYDEYAVQAFDRGAVDYLLKPIKRDRLARTLERVQEGLASGKPSELRQVISALQAQLAARDSRERIKWITARAGQTTKIFSIDEVLYFRAQDKYTRVVTATDAAHIRAALKDLLEQLDPDAFWQVHRSVIVRAAAIRCVRRGDDGNHSLLLKDAAEELPVSSAFQHRFKGM